MTYHFRIGERVHVNPQSGPPGRASWLRADNIGAVVATLPASGPPNASGIRSDRVRVKLDAWPRALIFNAMDVNPI